MASLWLVDTQRHQQARIHSLRPALDGLLFDSKMAVVAHPQVLDILPILVEVVLTPCPQPLWLGTIECPRLHAIDIVAISVQREACRTVKLVPVIGGAANEVVGEMHVVRHMEFCVAQVGTRVEAVLLQQQANEEVTPVRILCEVARHADGQVGQSPISG